VKYLVVKFSQLGRDSFIGLTIKNMYYRVGRYVYYEAENAIGMVTRCGEVVMGIDGYYIQWYA
jgi:hypothetical protein